MEVPFHVWHAFEEGLLVWTWSFIHILFITRASTCFEALSNGVTSLGGYLVDNTWLRELGAHV